MLKIITSVSFFLFLVSISLVPLSFFANAYDHYVSLNGTTHVGLMMPRVYSADRWFPRKFAIPDPSIVFFSDAEYGPYQGSIIGLTIPEQSIYFGETWGIYYRYFPSPDGSSFWTLEFSLWYPIFIFSLFPIAWAFSRFGSNYSLRTLLFVTTVFAIMFGTLKLTGVYHPITIAAVLFAVASCLLVWTCCKRLFTRG